MRNKPPPRNERRKPAESARVGRELVCSVRAIQ